VGKGVVWVQLFLLIPPGLCLMFFEPFAAGGNLRRGFGVRGLGLSLIRKLSVNPVG